jgi:hypothetical protein
MFHKLGSMTSAFLNIFTLCTLFNLYYSYDHAQLITFAFTTFGTVSVLHFLDYISLYSRIKNDKYPKRT